MALKINVENKGGPTVEAKKRFYLSKDGSKLVPEGDPEAGSLYAPAGGQMPKEEYERLSGKKKRAKRKPKAEPDESEE